MITFKIYGEPTALKRHRSFNKKGQTINYDPSKGDKADFLMQALKYKPKIPADFPIHLACTFVFSRPKSHYRTGKNSNLLKESAPYYHSSVPDHDNLMKFVSDALNGVFWKDDSFIVRSQALKIYTNEHKPMIVVSMKEAIPEFDNWKELLK